MTKTIFFLLLLYPTTAVAGETLAPLFESYHQLQTALAGDDLQAAKSAASKLQTAAQNVKTANLGSATLPIWQQQSAHLAGALAKANAANDLSNIRKPFEHISTAMIALAKVTRPGSFQEYRCSMAFNNKGANWLQKDGKTANPYFGSSMLRCGSRVKSGS